MCFMVQQVIGSTKVCHISFLAVMCFHVDALGTNNLGMCRLLLCKHIIKLVLAGAFVYASSTICSRLVALSSLLHSFIRG